MITEQLAGQRNVSYSNETTVPDSVPETTVLHTESGETTVLDALGTNQASGFVIEHEITFIHTNEVIV